MLDSFSFLVVLVSCFNFKLQNMFIHLLRVPYLISILSNEVIKLFRKKVDEGKHGFTEKIKYIKLF